MSVRMMAAAMLLLLVCSNLQAEEKKAKGKKGAAQRTPQALTLPESIDLTEEQEKQVNKIRQELAKEARELQKKNQELIPADTRREQAEAMKAARESGKSRQEIQAMMKAQREQLPAETQEALAEARKESQKLRQTFIEKVSAVLTDEQKAELPKSQAGKKGSGKGKKKQDNA